MSKTVKKLKDINIKYPMHIRPLSEDDGSGYLVEFPNFPGCFAEGETLEEAIRQVPIAIRSWVNCEECAEKETLINTMQIELEGLRRALKTNKDAKKGGVKRTI